jgi:hypothetical protein
LDKRKFEKLLSVIAMLLMALVCYLLWLNGARCMNEAHADDAVPVSPPQEAPQLVDMQPLDPIEAGEMFIEDRVAIWNDPDPQEELATRFVRAIFRSRSLKRPPGAKGPRRLRWERCGQKVPKEEFVTEAASWAWIFIESLEQVEQETGVALNPWGAFATSANESGFNECSLNYAARKWASEHIGRELITETWKGKTARRKVTKKVVEKFRLTYDRDTVWRIINHPDYAKASVQVRDPKTGKMRTVRLRNKFDGGPFQLRKSVRKLSRAEFDQLTSVHPGLYLGLREMARRAKDAQHRYRLKDVHPRPWVCWPGWNINHAKNLKYDRKITMVARWLGARKGEI